MNLCGCELWLLTLLLKVWKKMSTLKVVEQYFT